MVSLTEMSDLWVENQEFSFRYINHKLCCYTFKWRWGVVAYLRLELRGKIKAKYLDLEMIKIWMLFETMRWHKIF